MRSGDQALDSSHSRHELAWLVLRLIEKLAPCTEASLSDRAKSAMEEIARADDYGLRASEYELPKAEGFSPDDAVNWLADAEVKISIAVLRYAYDPRGGPTL